jgi:hypothetical protein
VTYQEWFAGQPEDVQRGILGEGRYEVYGQGKLSLAEMVGATGGPLSLDALQENIFQQQFRSLLAKAQQILPSDFPIEARSFADKEIEEIKREHRIANPVKTVGGLCDPDVPIIVFNEDFHRDFYSKDYSTGEYHSITERSGKIQYKKPEQLQLWIYAHELAHITESEHGKKHWDMTVFYYKKLARTLLLKP